jgi:1-deoxy-D-xylulose-5-phosphate reductoisomerase
MRKRAIVLGSTGSIGQSSLDVLAHLSDEWEVVGLAAGSNGRLLAEQANQFRPKAVALADAQAHAELSGTMTFRPQVWAGPNAMEEMLDAVPCDCVIAGIVGVGGLRATIKAVELGVRVALANKEALVIAGSLLMPLARRTGATIIPIDSEHSAILQAMRVGQPGEVRAVYLTASGGPFRTWTAEALEAATLEDALRHPTWQMGPKVTIDSATMMNKAMEIVEARWFFDLRPDQIQVVVHPESIIHSFVEFCDGSVIAQLGTPDMRTPIQYALTYPERRNGASRRLNLLEIQQLSFHPPDVERFPAIRLGHWVAARGGTSGAVLNGANEAAVEFFRKGLMRFQDIARETERAMNGYPHVDSPSFDELIAADQWARQEVARCRTR